MGTESAEVDREQKNNWEVNRCRPHQMGTESAEVDGEQKKQLGSKPMSTDK